MKLTLIDKKPEAENCFSFIFIPDENINWKAGQYLRYKIDNPNPDARGVNHFFTISAAPFEKNIMLTTRFVEDGSSFKKDLQNLKIGDQIETVGPLGSFIIEDPARDYVFIAGGIGITPFRSILLELDHHSLPINVTLLYASRNNDIVFKEGLDALSQKHPSLKIHYIVDPQKIDHQVIHSAVSQLSSVIYYLSGPEPMVKNIEKILEEELMVEKEQIKTDYFPGYARI